MSDDFVRLVSQANPASGSNGGYTRAGNGGTGYPPSQQLMDPFFDDEDEPDSAFGPGTRGVGNAGMASKESFGTPLKSNAAPMAGASQSKVSLGGQPQGWNFDDDDVAVPTLPTVAPHVQAQSKKRKGRRKELFKWPWAKEEKVEGERVVALNTPGAGTEFIHNGVSTSKYNVATFGPKFLFGALLLLPWAVCVCIHRRGRKNSSANTPTCSSCSPRVYSRSLASAPQTGGRPSRRSQSFSSPVHSKRSRRTWYGYTPSVWLITINNHLRNDTHPILSSTHAKPRFSHPQTPSKSANGGTFKWAK